MKRTVSAILLVILLTSMLCSAFNIMPAEAAGTIYIRADGSIDPPTAPIQRDGDLYTLTGNITSDAMTAVKIQKDDVILDGASHELKGTKYGDWAFPSMGIELLGRRNVIVRNIRISLFLFTGIWVSQSSKIQVITNDITACNNTGIDISESECSMIDNNITRIGGCGIILEQSSNNVISGNSVADCATGMRLQFSSSGNSILDNTVANNTDEGIEVAWQSDHNTIVRNCVTGSNDGLHLSFFSNFNNISMNCVISNRHFGMRLESSSSNILRNNNLTNNRYNFWVWGSSLQEFINDVDGSNTADGKIIRYWLNESDKSVPPDAAFVALVNCTHILIQNLSFSSQGFGVLLAFTNDSAVSRNSFAGDYGGILLQTSFNNSANENSINVPGSFGIRLCGSSSNTLSGNNITDDGSAFLRYNGIELNGSSNNTVSENNLSAEHSWTTDGYGLYIDGSDNYIFRNKVTKFEQGLALWGSRNKLRNNTMANNHDNFGLMTWLSTPSDFMNDIDISNEVEGRPIYYWTYEQNRDVPLEAGYVALVNCTNIGVRNLELKHNIQGLFMAFTNNSTIIQNSIFSNGYGFVTGAEKGSGLELIQSSNNNISRNLILGNEVGIQLCRSSNDTFSENNITSNSFGAWLEESSNNRFSQNRFEDSSQRHVRLVTSGYQNLWDADYPNGNFWDDYVDVDEYGGPYQNETGSDGVWDHPYTIDENNRDRYPIVPSPLPNDFIDLTVPYEPQGNAPWCWAASTAMLLRYYGKPVHVWEVGKDLISVDSLNQIEIYIHEKYPGEFETERGIYSSISGKTRHDMEGNLSIGYPVLLRVYSFTMGGHMVVVTGYNSSGFFINDPSGAFFVEGLKEPRDYTYIHEFVAWEDLEPFIDKDPFGAVFLVVRGAASPPNATLSLINDEMGIRTIHDSNDKSGVCIDYGDWYWAWDLDWRPISWHPRVWDSKDKLAYLFNIFNHKNETAEFDFCFRITGQDGIAHYTKNVTGILVSPFGEGPVVDLEEREIVLKNYLVAGQQYTVTAEIRSHESSEIVDSITLPPIYYGVKSILFVTECPVRMLVTDPDRLRVGFDSVSNQTVREIHGALYYYGNGSELEIISIPNQKNGNYSITVFGIEDGSYNLTCAALDETGLLSIQSFEKVSIAKDESQTYAIPEFPSFLVMPLFIIVTLLAIIASRRKRLKHQIASQQ